jgi:hypothetical protein
MRLRVIAQVQYELYRLPDLPVPIAWLEADFAGGYGRRWVDAMTQSTPTRSGGLG